MITNKVTIERKTIEEAPTYHDMDPAPEMLTLDKVIIVKRGMQSGQPTFDLQMRDKHGKLFLAMVTGNIMLNILSLAKPEFNTPGQG